MILSGETVFITGGAGFIGSHLIRRLIADNVIVVWDNLARNALHLWGLQDHPHLTSVQGDILDYENLKAALPEGTTLVLHMAAIAGIDTVAKEPVRTMEVNAIGTYNILRALGERGLLPQIKRFVEFSTSEVFGVNAFQAGDQTPSSVKLTGEPRWCYAVSKLTGEYLAHSFARERGLRMTIVRPFNVYGPGQVGEGAIRNMVLRCLRGEPLMIQGDGNQVRSWCYVDDMVNAVLLTLTEERAVGQAFNIGNPRATLTIRSLAEKIVQLTESASPIIHVPRAADVDLRVPDITKARELLGYEPKVDLDEGIRSTSAWYRERLMRGEG